MRNSNRNLIAHPCSASHYAFQVVQVQMHCGSSQEAAFPTFWAQQCQLKNGTSAKDYTNKNDYSRCQRLPKKYTWLYWDLPFTYGQTVQLLLITRRGAKSQISVIRKCCWWQKSAAGDKKCCWWRKSAAGDLASVKSKWRGSMSRAFWSASWQSSRLGLLIPVESFAWWNYLIINMLMANVLAPADAWILKKIRGVDKNLWLVYFYQPWAICGIFFRGCSQSPRLFSTFDPNLFHLWRQWGSWVAPGSRALHCIGAHHCIGAQHWCPPKQNIQNAILVNGTLQMYKLAPMHRMHWP